MKEFIEIKQTKILHPEKNKEREREREREEVNTDIVSSRNKR